MEQVFIFEGWTSSLYIDPASMYDEGLVGEVAFCMKTKIKSSDGRPQKNYGLENKDDPENEDNLKRQEMKMTSNIKTT